MWFPFIWLSIGFLKKTWDETFEKWGAKLFDTFFAILSFSLVIIVFGALHLTTWQACVVFVFWLFIADAVRSNKK